MDFASGSNKPIRRSTSRSSRLRSMLRRRGHPERASVLRAARANRRTSAPRGIDIEQMHRRPADRVAVGLRPHGSWSAAVARWSAGRPVCIPDRGSALPASGNSGGTAGELAPHPTRGHLPSVHDVLSAGVDQERGVEQATRRRRHGLRRDITAAGAAGCPSAESHRTRTDAGNSSSVPDLHSRR